MMEWMGWTGDNGWNERKQGWDGQETMVEMKGIWLGWTGNDG